MRIIGIRSENIKRLKVFDLTPNKYINRISGGNGSGKTSALDAIEWALTGTSNVPTQPVRRGAGRAVTELDLGDLLVVRRFTEGGPRNGTLTVESKGTGTRYTGPQDLLDSKIGKISFDPLEFLRMHPSKQLEVLKSLVKLRIDLESLEAAYKADYLRRRELKKEKTAVETRRDAVYVVPGLPKEKLDEAALVKELQEASSFNEDVARQQRDRDLFNQNRDTLARDIDEQMERVTAMRAEADRLQAEADGWAKQLEKNDKAREKWKPLPEPKDATALAKAITEARTTNQGIDRRKLRDEYDAEAAMLDSEINTLNNKLEEAENIKTAALTEAEFPVPGLAFGEEEVIYNGFPFTQVSNAEQIRCAVAIGMATNPELRVMRIKDGSLLDEAALEVIAEMAQEQDFQVWIEQVDQSGKVGVYLEDGEVAAINDEPLDKPKGAKPARKPRKKKEAASA